MKRVGITQRVEVISSYGEQRDCLDQRWTPLCLDVGLAPLPLPNVAATRLPEIFNAWKLDAIILSGGNSLTSLAPEATDAAPERDTFEAALIDLSIARCLPLLGVCRGLQMLNVHLGGSLVNCHGHVATRHSLRAVPGYESLIFENANSFHTYALPASGLAPGLQAIAYDAEGQVEAFRHESHKITAIMWHPERETPYRPQDIQLIRKALEL